MDILYSNQEDGQFQNAEKVMLSDSAKNGRTTPYVTADGSFLLYAAINESLDLMICYKDENEKWGRVEKLSYNINTNGQGNP